MNSFPKSAPCFQPKPETAMPSILLEDNAGCDDCDTMPVELPRLPGTIKSLLKA
jgi:hypothetical protein